MLYKTNISFSPVPCWVGFALLFLISACFYFLVYYVEKRAKSMSYYAQNYTKRNGITHKVKKKLTKKKRNYIYIYLIFSVFCVCVFPPHLFSSFSLFLAIKESCQMKDLQKARANLDLFFSSYKFLIIEKKKEKKK